MQGAALLWQQVHRLKEQHRLLHSAQAGKAQTRPLPARNAWWASKLRSCQKYAAWQRDVEAGRTAGNT